MGRFTRGAPVQYARDGQAYAARRETFNRAGYREKGIMHLLHNKPEELRKKLPRITWAEVMKPILDDENLVYTQELLHADQQPAEFEDFNHVPERLRFQAALALYDCRAPVPSVRSAVELAWISHSGVFKALAGDDLHPVLRYCDFKPPASLGPVFSIWRGTRGVSLEVARQGKSWTTDPRVACVWVDQINRANADGGGRITGAPLVIRRDARAEDVAFYSNKQGMFEVVLGEDVAPDGEPDGDRAEWSTVAVEHGERLRLQLVLERAGLFS